MFDPGAPSSVLAIAELNKPGTMHEIHGIALLRSGHEEDAKDLAMVSIARVLDPDDLPWHLGGHTFLVHMFSVVRQTWYRQRRKRSARSEVPDGGEAQDNTANDGELPDAEVARKREFETQRMLGERLLERLAGDSDAVRLLEQQKTRDLEPSELAAALGWTVDKVRATQKRIAYHGEIVLNEWKASEELRRAGHVMRTHRRSQLRPCPAKPSASGCTATSCPRRPLQPSRPPTWRSPTRTALAHPPPPRLPPTLGGPLRASRCTPSVHFSHRCAVAAAADRLRSTPIGLVPAHQRAQSFDRRARAD